MLSLYRFAYTVAVRKVFSHWRLELHLFLGIVLAVTLMSSVVIFSDLVAEASLRHTLQQAEPEEANFLVRTFSGSEAPPTGPGRLSHYQAKLEFGERQVTSRFRPYMREQARFLETATFFFRGHPHLELGDEVRPRGPIKYIDGLTSPRIEMVDGRWPYSIRTELSDNGPLEVAVDTLGAQFLQLDVGEEMEIFPASFFTEPLYMKVKLVGVFKRVDPDDEYWYGSSRKFSYQYDKWDLAPLFTTEEAIFGPVIQRYPTLYTHTTWFYFLDREGVSAKQVRSLRDTTRRIKGNVRSNSGNFSISLKLDQVLDDFQQQLLLARIPLFLILFLVTGILIYYLALVSGLIVKSRSDEITMLKSRGASTVQVGTLALAEGLLLAVPAVILGPLLALGMVQGLGRAFFGLSGGGELATVPVTLSSQAFSLGLMGGFLAIAVLTTLTLFAARRDFEEFRQTRTRPPRTPFIHRYYLDVLFLALAALLWWQIQSRGSFLVRPLGGQGLELDYSLFLGPVLGIFSVGLVVLRFFPIILALISRLAEPVGPSWAVHGLRRISRDPIVPGMVVVLLMYATSLGVVGSAFSSTLELSQRDQALYAAGADLRLLLAGTQPPVPILGLSDLVDKVDSVVGSAEVTRSRSYMTTTAFGSGATLLAVDAPNFQDVAWYRPDFAGGMALTELTKRLTPESSPPLTPDPGLLLPSDSQALALWVKPSRPTSRLFLTARLQDAQGRYFDIFVGDLNFREWRRLEAKIAPLLRSGRRNPVEDPMPQVTPPFTLLTLKVVSRFGLVEPGAIFLSNVIAMTPRGEQTLDTLENLDRWQVLEDSIRPGLYALERSKLTPPGEGSSFAGSAVFSWAAGGVGSIGIRQGAPERPIPALASRSLLAKAKAQVGETVVLGFSSFSLPFQIVSDVDYFPTLDPEDRPFLVADLATFTRQANLHSPRPVGGSNELWVDLDSEGATADAVVDALSGGGQTVRDAHIAAEMVSQRVAQPLVTAAWGGLVVLMLLALVLASASGLVMFSFMETRERQTEFALLRTLGTSRKQLRGVAWFSLVLVVALGIGLGSWVGQQFGNSLLPLLEVAQEGVRATPPMVLTSNRVSLLVSYLVIAGVTLGTVVWLAWFTAKMEVQQVLRIGEG